MSNLKYKTVDLEEATPQHQYLAQQQRPKPFLVVENHAPFGDSFSGQPSDIMDYALAQGSMPT